MLNTGRYHGRQGESASLHQPAHRRSACYVSSQIDGIEEERLKQYDIENLDKILEEVHSDVKTDEHPQRRERWRVTIGSAAVSYLIGIILTFTALTCVCCSTDRW